MGTPPDASWLHPRFGRRVAQLRAKSTLAAGIYLATLCGGMGLATLFAAKFPAKLIGLLLFGVGGYLLHHVRSRSSAKIELFERGVRLHSPAIEELALDSIRSASFRITDVIVNGGYNHTVGEITLATDVGDVRWRANIERNDASFFAVRSIFSTSIAPRLREAVDREGRADWIPGVALTRDGVEIDSGFVGGQKQTRAVRYADLVVASASGRCELRRRGEREPVRVVDESDANFYPGLLVLEQVGLQQLGRKP